MFKYQIIHAIDNLGLGGGQVMMAELYHGIRKYYPDITQSIITFDNRRMNKRFISSYTLSKRDRTSS